MRCNQRFFGQELFEKDTEERELCSRLARLKPAMLQYDFAIRDRLPPLPADEGGCAQVKYNGMLSFVLLDSQRGGFVAWSTRGRCYYSLSDHRRHPVIEYFNRDRARFRDLILIGETYAVRTINGKCYMTEFNKTMSIIKNPKTIQDVKRIRLAVFDYAERRSDGQFSKPAEYTKRFRDLQDHLKFPIGCDGNVVHLPDHLEAPNSFHDSYTEIQAFWNRYVKERGFEGLVAHTSSGKIYKIKFRDTLDAVIIAFRKAGKGRPVCQECGTKFDSFWLRKLAREKRTDRPRWFSQDGRLINGKNDVWLRNLDSCPMCEGTVSNTAGPILGAKIALMTPSGDFLDIADGAQLSPLSKILDMIEPLYEDEGYLWVRPEIVVEISYQDLYLDRPRTVYRYTKDRYVKIDTKRAVSLRPYRLRLRSDKHVSPQDLRLEQLNYFVNKIKRIEKSWIKEKEQMSLSRFIHQSSTQTSNSDREHDQE